jgi:hypothetical protein
MGRLLQRLGCDFFDENEYKILSTLALAIVFDKRRDARFLPRHKPLTDKLPSDGLRAGDITPCWHYALFNRS